MHLLKDYSYYGKAEQIARELHTGVYCDDFQQRSLLYRLEDIVHYATPRNALTGPTPSDETCNNIIAAAWLCKSWDKNCLAAGQKPLAVSKIKRLFNANVAKIVSELSSEPIEDYTLSPQECWQQKANWATGLSKESQMILMAQNEIQLLYQSFVCEMVIKNVEERMQLIDAIQKCDPIAYTRVCQKATDTINHFKDKQKTL